MATETNPLQPNPLQSSAASKTSRASVLLYGALCYAMFLVTFLYALGFVGGFGVPTSLDSAPSGPFWPALAVNTGCSRCSGCSTA